MASIAKKDMPAFVRRCYKQFIDAERKNREAQRERMRFYVGGDFQWRTEELNKRKNMQRPWVTINRMKPAVDQVEGDVRLNPPGPKVAPVGEGADGDTADIIAGLIRETEYRSQAKTCYATAGKYSAAGGLGVLELSTEFTGDRTWSQQLVINSVEDPETVFWDPTARKANRQDANWGGKLKMYGKAEYIGLFGDKRAVLKTRNAQAAMGWIQEAIKYEGQSRLVSDWTNNGDGPFFVAEFYMVETDQMKLRMYSDGVPRFDDERDTIPKGVTERPGDEYTPRLVPRRKVMKYLVDAFENLDEPTEWFGDIIPLIPVLGPEVYIDGKLHRLSLISGAMDSQRALNYVATTATELAGALPKSPWIGPAGTFDDPRWQTANSEMWAYLEYKPVFVTSDVTGAQQLAPAPQRNQWEAPIQWLLALAAYFADAIKATTAIYDASLGQQKGDQSGVAIQQLRSESNVGNFSYTDNLHRAIEVMYDQMCLIFPKILDGARVVTIVRPDNEHELAEINKEFTDEEKRQAQTTGKSLKSNNITLGRFSVRCTAGPSFETRQEQAIEALTGFFKAVPQTLGVPGVASKFLRLIGQGNPQVDGMADLLEPPGQGENGEPTPATLTQLQQQNQALTTLVQKMQQAIQMKQPEIDQKKFDTLINSITKIRVAEITASKDSDKADADRVAAQLEALLGMAHESAQQSVQHEHEASQAENQTQLAAANAEQSQNGVS